MQKYIYCPKCSIFCDTQWVTQISASYSNLNCIQENMNFHKNPQPIETKSLYTTFGRSSFANVEYPLDEKLEIPAGNRRDNSIICAKRDPSECWKTMEVVADIARESLE